ncbi:MAG TPA: ankyrin repeat domain-containing protein [Terriglobia bacterium]|nr:ankyrin repeat domain-containing protein [Terriglobia bacterium]
MTGHPGDKDPLFHDAVHGLLRGDFSRLEPLFDDQASPDHQPCRIREWYEKGYFDQEPKALTEAFTCACFLGKTNLADFLWRQGVDPTAGAGTGVNAFHWAANRGQFETVRLLIERRVPLEIRNRFGGTVLGMAVWSAIHEPKPDHLAIIEALISAGARLEDAGYPTGNERVDDLLRRHGAKP